MCGAVATFSCLDTTAKYLVQSMDPLQITWARYTGAFVLVLIFLNPFKRPGMMVTQRPLLQIGRSILLLGSSALNFFAVRYLQLDEALAILFATPFLVAVLGSQVLGERVGSHRWIAIGIGFVGVLIVTRPGIGGMHPAALLSVAGAICYTLYSVSTRLLARTDSTETTTFYTNMVGAVVLTPVVYFVWSTPQSIFLAFLMGMTGFFGGFGHYLLVRGHRLAPASTLSPFIYTQMVWTSSLGFLVFGDVPHFWTIVGSVVVIGSGLYLLHYERKVGKTMIQAEENQ
ncbi:DMT family transporter [Undibacter mobilis]|uniref:DMT family transporter n=2 Tax=Undibacter mobilis TaxID=2292256 RepID=A0A371BE21_9BRAD|nr:DMT family transporter [Undibacter mobilis]